MRLTDSSFIEFRGCGEFAAIGTKPDRLGLFWISSWWKPQLPSKNSAEVNLFDSRNAVIVRADLFSDHLGLAEVISLEYTNIPGALPSEALSEAQQALFRASETYNPARGEFGPYAAKVIRNALNTLYAKNLRIARIFPKSLDEAPQRNGCSSEGSSPSSFGADIRDSAQDVVMEARRRESDSVLEETLNCLSPRERIVVEGVRSGKSLSEIGEGLGISKQAAHKVSTLAFQKLHERLRLLGYQGLDSKGLLKSHSTSIRRLG